MSDFPENKEAWLKLLKHTSIPSFSSSIQALSSVEDYSSSHSSELARTILKDPNLTASVLKLANSAQFNTYGRSIRTVSRSIMVLGHKAIREVCASCLLMEQFLKQGSSNNLQALVARSFHAAIQAKEIAQMQGLKSTEEIFISALLLSLGEIAVYSAIEPANSLSQKLRDSYPLSGGQEKDIIGCYFNDLTLGLCDAWNIAPMIGEMLEGKYAENSPTRSILLGSSFASSCELTGLNRAISVHLKSITRYTGKSPEIVTDKLVQATEDTQKSLTQFGIKLDVKQPRKSVEVQSAAPIKIEVDKILQLDVIQELSVLSQESVDINVILQHLLEGIHRGASFSCALVALLNRDKSRIVAKHAIEKRGSQTKENFNFSCYHDIPEIHRKVMTNRNIIQQNQLRPQGATLRAITKRTGCQQAVWGPLIVENKAIGCIYADNGLNGPPISQEQLEAFQLFVCQAKLFLYQLK
ncbi:HDOD domain-containing protein [Aliikangiella coralliicola]|uniref:HDOD domain-containing protein n=1 Tax=Aliikangiella coralliicola TaxID=2592383 RepID=A0A545UAU2_9GAMM|nr:HDOD domain-containing protein [Aliikangiella coralliicola]TQV86591.1 HDOD domain-containing protein [Aliikangiella coralliicola]